MKNAELVIKFNDMGIKCEDLWCSLDFVNHLDVVDAIVEGQHEGGCHEQTLDAFFHVQKTFVIQVVDEVWIKVKARNIILQWRTFLLITEIIEQRVR